MSGCVSGQTDTLSGPLSVEIVMTVFRLAMRATPLASALASHQVPKELALVSHLQLGHAINRLTFPLPRCRLSPHTPPQGGQAAAHLTDIRGRGHHKGVMPPP